MKSSSVLPWLLIALLSTTFTQAAPASAAATASNALLLAQTGPAPGSSLDERLVTELQPLDVLVNGAALGNYLLLRRQGVFHATRDIFEEWRLVRPTGEPVEFRGQSWYPLDTVRGYQAEFNSFEQSVALRFSPDAFAATRLVQEAAERPSLTPAIPTFFLNYDLSYTRSVSRGVGPSEDAGALFEAGTSGQWGVVTSTFLFLNLTNPDPLNAPRTLRRLETTFTRDLPESRLTLRIGDSATRAASWGRSVYFGGLQIGRNFGLVPGFISQPLPVISGVSAAPSTVDLYINDALRQTSQVPAGPFAIDNFPLLTGSGQARIVVRDVLGRETIVVQDFFSHASLLEDKLTDWSLELGAVRERLGLASADYGQKFGSGLLRRGLSKTLTAEGRVEIGQKTRGLGFGVVTALPLQVLGQFAVAASQNANAGRGHLWQAAMTHSNRRHGVTLNVQGASPSYRQIGQDDSSPSYRHQVAGSYTYDGGIWGSVGLGFAMVDSPVRGRITTYNVNYSRQVGKATVTLNAVHVRDPDVTGGGTSIGVNLFMPLGHGIMASSNINHRGGVTEGFVSASRGLSTDTGVGWRALTGYRQEEGFVEGGISLQASHSLSSVDISQSRTRQTVRVGLQGGLVWADGRIYASRRVSDSFAVVEVPGYPNIGINVYGSTVARTDAQGRALIPRLLPYQANDVRLDATELPISAELDSIEQRVVPAARSAVKIVFPVRIGRGALVKIVFDDGEPAPSAAELELVGDKEEFFVARRGEAFITGLKDRNEVKLKWRGATCTFELVLPPGNPDDIARIGPVVCPGIKR